MPPRHQTLPPAQTSSAREAQKSFYCQLCSKGYSRMNDYEAHLSSYDHSHKQRLRDMKAMVRDPNATNRARRAEAKADGIVSIKLAGQESSASGPASSSGTSLGGGGGGGFKKGGFKKSGFKSAFAPVDAPSTTAASATADQKKQDAKAPPSSVPKPALVRSSELQESDTEDEGYEVYDPRYPTD